MKTLNNSVEKRSIITLILFAVLVLLTSINASAQTTIWTESFNNTSAFTASGGTGYEDSDEYFRIKTSSTSEWDYNGNVGSFFAGRDIDDWHSSGNTARLTWSGIDISNYQSLQFSGNFASMEDEIDNNDKIDIEYRIDGGSWYTLFQFREDDDELEETTTNTGLAQTFKTLSASINDTGSTLDLRIEIEEFNKGNEDFAFDEFTLTGVQTTSDWTFWAEDFDSANVYSVTNGSMGSSGTKDFFHVTNTMPSQNSENITGAQGNYLAGRDVDSWYGAGNRIEVTWDSISVTNMSNLVFSVELASMGSYFEKKDELLFQYKIDNGSWTNLLMFNGNGSGSQNELAVNTNFTGEANGREVTNTFSAFYANIVGTGSLLTLKLSIEKFKGGAENFAIDNVTLSGDVLNNTIIYSSGSWSPAKPNEYSGAINVLVQNGSVELNSIAECDNLTVNNGATLTIKKDKVITVNNAIINNGTINVEDHGVLNQTVLVDNNSGTGTFNVSRETQVMSAANTYNIWSSPVNGESTGDVFGNASANSIYSNNGSGWVTAGHNTVMQPGVGYTAFGDANATYPTSFVRTFSGNSVNNGDVTVTGIVNNNSVRMIGNPYPSPISAEALFIDNPQIEVLYLWDHNSNQISNGQYTVANWATYLPNLNTGTKVCPTCLIPNGTIGVAQGFNIGFDTSLATTSVVFKNSQRNIDGNYRFHAPIEMSKVWINLSNNTGDFDQIAIVFTENNSLAYEEGFEAAKSSLNPDLSFYSIADSHNLAIQTVGKPDLNHDLRIPLGVDAGVSGDFTFEIDSLSNWSEDFNLYLIDKATGATTYIEEGQAYTFTVTTSASFTDRFYIEVRIVQNEDQNETIAINQPDTVLTDEGHELDALEETKTTSTEIIWNGVEARVIENTSDVSSWMVFNVNGQLVETLKSSSNSEIITAPQSGIYLLKVTFDNGSSTAKKIFIR